MMEIDLQGWLTSVLASWGLVSVADALAHGVMSVSYTHLINLRRTENVSQPIEKSISAERFSVLRRLIFVSYPVVN